MNPALIIAGIQLITSIVDYLHKADKKIPLELLKQRNELRRLIAEEADALATPSPTISDEQAKRISQAIIDSGIISDENFSVIGDIIESWENNPPNPIADIEEAAE